MLLLAYFERGWPGVGLVSVEIMAVVAGVHSEQLSAKSAVPAK